MAIKLHSLVSTGKRYFQIETQPHHIIGIFKKLSYYKSVRKYEFLDEDYIHYECHEDGTVTFYKAGECTSEADGIWTYVTYDCPEGREEIFPDSSAYTNTDALNRLLSGEKIVVISSDLNEYVQYQLNNNEYLNVELPLIWYTQSRREIAIKFVEEIEALAKCHVFTSYKVGREYAEAVLAEFILAATEVAEMGGSLADFESAQYIALSKINIEPVANLIMEQNDYRIWQSAMPSKSKAVEYAFNTALEYISKAI
ncbi:MAG: hypothetical protein AAF378_08970 [Cyanobacteria bacterium P01_A01_bin.84]